MKKILSFLSVLGFLSISTAQNTNKMYDKWSVEFNEGLNKAFYNWEYDGAPTRLAHLDLGVRYMLNDKFGFKAAFGHDQLKNNKSEHKFKTNIYRYNIEGVFNIGRLLSFEDWTGRIGLLLHAGGGLTKLNYSTVGGRKNDASHLMIGVTPQIKISNRVVLTIDVTSINNFQQAYTFDGYNRPEAVIKGTGTVQVNDDTGTTTIEIADPSAKFLKHMNPILNTSIGVTYYFGKNKKHVDWAAVDEIKTLTEEEQN